MIRRLVQIALGAVLVAVTLASGAVAWLAWYPESLKAPLERLLSAQLGQPVRIEGGLRFNPGRVTTVELHGLRIAAPEWARADDLVAVDRLKVGADLWAYLRHGTIKITELVLVAPRVNLERDGQERTSWPVGDAASKGGGMPLLSLGRVEITAGRIDFLDAASAIDLTADVATDGTAAQGIGLQLDGRGTAQGNPLAFALHAGSVQRAAFDGGSMPLDGSLTLANTRIELAGEIGEPAAFAGVDLQLELTSDDPSDLLALAGRAVPTTPPPLAASAQLTGGGRSFAVNALQVRWGESAVDGRMSLDLAQAEPRLDGSLRADLLDLATLLPMLTSADRAPAAAGPVGNPLQVLAGYQGRVELTAGEIRLPSQALLHDAAIMLDLADDRLTVPLRVGLPEGVFEGELVAAPLSATELAIATDLTAAGAGIAGLAGEGFAGTVDGSLKGTLVVGSPETMLQRSRLRFEGRGADLALPEAELGSIEVTAVLEEGRLRLDPLEAILPQGEISGQVVAGPFDAGFSAEIDLNANGIDLAAAARAEGIAGRLDGHLSGVVRGAAPLDILTRSRVRLVGTIAGLRLPQVERRIGEAEIDASLDPDRREALKIVARAQAGDRPLSLTVFGGSFATLEQNRGDYPFTVVSALGNNDIKVNGTVSLPLSERKFAATVNLAGPDPSPILALFELPKLQFPPYRLSGVLTNKGDELLVKDLDGRIGDSDFSADLTLSRDGERPKLSGKLSSKVLDVDDLGGLVGATPATGPGETASPGQEAEAAGKQREGELLPDEPLDPARWRAVDFDLDLRADELRAGKVPLDGLSGRLSLVNGVLRIDPLELLVGEGTISGRIEVDGARAPAKAEVALDLVRVSVARLLNRLDVDVATFGTLSGSARGGVGLGGTGFSIKDMLANSDGNIQLVMEGGQINRTIVAGLGLDLLRLFGSFVGAMPETVELRCTVANLEVRDGIVATRPLIIDTAIADLGGDGTIDLRSEAIEISLTARPDRTPLPTDLTGISISGTLAQPQIDINPLGLAARGIAAATLGVLMKPFTTLAGVADGEEPGPCSALLNSEPGEARG